MNIKSWIKGKRIAVLYGGTSSERKISLLSGKAVIDALKKLPCTVVPIDADSSLAEKLSRKKVDFAYIALHGPFGEDGTVQGLLEVMGIPYSGCGVLSSSVGMDKIATKMMCAASGIPTPEWQVLEKGCRITSPARFPVVVKPASQGSAIGISIVRKKKDFAQAVKSAFKLDKRVLVERFISGTEITVGIVGSRVLPAVEIVPANSFYDFDAKYTPGRSEHIIPPRLAKKVLERAKSAAVETFKALRCRAVSRIDIIVDRFGKPWVLEINTVPGMTQTSLLPDAAKAVGINFTELILQIINASLVDGRAS